MRRHDYRRDPYQERIFDMLGVFVGPALVPPKPFPAAPLFQDQ